jgi:hypothetical protein
LSYLGSMLQKDEDIDADVCHRIKAGWLKWSQPSSILCDKGVPQKLKVKFHRTTIKPAMLYGVEYWPTKRWHVQQPSVAEMRMLCWSCGHTRIDRVRNNDIRDRSTNWRKICPTSVEVVWPCSKETFRDTSALWSPKSRYQCEER